MFDRIPLPAELAKYPRAIHQATGRTVGEVISSVFPIGTDPTLGDDGTPEELGDAPANLERPPSTAPDLFAATSHLLEISGAFSYYSASVSHPVANGQIRLWASTEEIAHARYIGEVWARADVEKVAPQDICARWTNLLKFWEWPINARAYHATKTSPAWWSEAYFLFMAADEAAKSVGFPVSIDNTGKISKNLANYFEYRDAKRVAERVKSENRLLTASFSTMCRFASPDVVCVQPKALISAVGGGSRVFSHNLASLRPRGLVRTQWASSTYSAHADDAQNLNLLLIPMPFKLSARNFQPYRQSIGRIPGSTRRWRTFKVLQDWLDDAVSQIMKIIKQTIDMNHEVHGVILPELALDSETYTQLSDRISRSTSVEFLVSGCSQDCRGRVGNYVWCSRYDRKPGLSETIEKVFVQSKHHRWKLNSDQINRYRLDESLSARFDWWEHINVGGRELNFASFRSNSIFSCVICEDLARSEPCHEILRSIGPNLLFALLMDGPQYDERWPSRYSSYLSEDPGISVLTLTSRGLIELSNPGCENYYVAHFRDGAGKTTPVSCPGSAQAVLLGLEASLGEVESIDGRSKKMSNWRLRNKDGQTLIKCEG